MGNDAVEVRYRVETLLINRCVQPARRPHPFRKAASHPFVEQPRDASWVAHAGAVRRRHARTELRCPRSPRQTGPHVHMSTCNSPNRFLPQEAGSAEGTDRDLVGGQYAGSSLEGVSPTRLSRGVDAWGKESGEGYGTATGWEVIVLYDQGVQEPSTVHSGALSAQFRRRSNSMRADVRGRWGGWGAV